MPDLKKLNSKKIFVDADTFVALCNQDDPNHENAILLSKEISLSNLKLITSDFAFGEAVTVISQKVGKKKAEEFIDFVKTGEIKLMRNNEERENEAIVWFKKFASKNTRFTDCLNMAIMKELRINTILSFDIHYKKAGFKRLGIH